MTFLLLVGRFAFVLVFIVSGVQTLLDLSATAAMIEAKLVVPPLLIDAETRLQDLTALPLPRLLAIAAGLVEIACGLMIAANIGARFAALGLFLFTAVATALFHDFWTMQGAARAAALTEAMKNVSIMGALLLFILGAVRPQPTRYRDSQAAARY